MRIVCHARAEVAARLESTGDEVSAGASRKAGRLDEEIAISRIEIIIRPVRVLAGGGIDTADIAACEGVLRALPDWFGIEESLVQYVRDVSTYPTHVAMVAGKVAGFVTVHHHNPHASEVHCIAVRPEHHGSGVGTAMVKHVEGELRARGTTFLQVKTVGPGRVCESYARTREFYLARGFLPLEETPAFWGPRNPTLIMVKSLK